ncbi:TetR family transcriptional regulator [Jongsikchunia kroppenstedtii]|uniref:TetR family transcriptional regulator n=1 Tax=Jongsikchunia kroppenstedtii TaxID=1121721 RepID=UPI0005BB5FFB|nr:TetR family transcriptional regulator [Jongsikchunia kroppenstedtii]
MTDSGGAAGNSAPAVTRQIPFAEASKALLRNSLLDGMRDLLLTKTWSAVTMSDVGTAAGVSRQTVYNEFKSRQGLAQAYALRLADQLVDTVAGAIEQNEGRVKPALMQAFSDFFAASASDPLIQSLQTGEAKPDLLRLITTDSGPIITRSSSRLTELLQRSWAHLSESDAIRISRAIVRMALSFVAMPPEGDRDVADDLATLFAPALEVAIRPA